MTMVGYEQMERIHRLYEALPSEIDKWPMSWDMRVVRGGLSPWVQITFSPATPHPAEVHEIRLAMWNDSEECYVELPTGEVTEDPVSDADLARLVVDQDHIYDPVHHLCRTALTAAYHLRNLPDTTEGEDVRLATELERAAARVTPGVLRPGSTGSPR